MLFQSLSRDSGRLNPLWWRISRGGPAEFQSLSRDSGRLNHWLLAGTTGSGKTFQSLSRDSGRLNAGYAVVNVPGCCSFNPSVGIRGV